MRKQINTIFLGCTILIGCASSIPQKVFQPTGEGVEWYYVNGLPFGVVEDESSLLLLTLEPTSLSSRRYVRLWVLYQNKDQKSFLLDPGGTFSVKVMGFPEVLPESPTKILASIDNEKAASLILQAVGGALQTMSTQPTQITTSGGQSATVNDRREKQQVVQDRTKTQIGVTASYYDAFRESLSSGILRRNTLFQNQAVNGYVYFELPKDTDRQIRAEAHEFYLKIELFSGLKIIKFKPISGE